MIKDLKELKSLLLLCRKQGVIEINIDGCHIKLGDLPQEINHNELQEKTYPQDILTDEELIFYSAGGAIGEN